MNNRKHNKDKIYKGHKFSYKEVWELYYVFSRFIRNGLISFKKADRIAEKGELDDNLDQMIWSFDQIVQNEPDNPANKWLDQKFKELDGKNILTIHCPNDIIEEEKIYHAKIQNGIDLFAKFFLQLWD